MYSIYEDRAGDLWVGTGLGINRLDRSTGKFTRFDRGPVAGRTALLPIYAFLETRAGDFWFGAGQLRGALDRNTGAVTSASEAGGLTFHEDREGNFWIGSMLRLRKVDPSGSVRTIPLAAAPGGRQAVPVQVNYIHEDRAGPFWLGTESGLIRFDPKSEQFTSYTTRDGLPDNVVQRVLPDRAGNLWLSTNNGISRFNPQDRTLPRERRAAGRSFQS